MKSYDITVKFTHTQHVRVFVEAENEDSATDRAVSKAMEEIPSECDLGGDAEIVKVVCTDEDDNDK